MANRQHSKSKRFALDLMKRSLAARNKKNQLPDDVKEILKLYEVVTNELKKVKYPEPGQPNIDENMLVRVHTRSLLLLVKYTYQRMRYLISVHHLFTKDFRERAFAELDEEYGSGVFCFFLKSSAYLSDCEEAEDYLKLKILDELVILLEVVSHSCGLDDAQEKYFKLECEFENMQMPPCIYPDSVSDPELLDRETREKFEQLRVAMKDLESLLLSTNVMGNESEQQTALTMLKKRVKLFISEREEKLVEYLMFRRTIDLLKEVVDPELMVE